MLWNKLWDIQSILIKFDYIYIYIYPRKIFGIYPYPSLLLYSLILYATGCAKSHDKNDYCLMAFKIELCRNFPFIYSFFIPYSAQIFHKIWDNSKFMNSMANN